MKTKWVISSLIALIAFGTAQAAIISEFYDFGTDTGKTTYQAAGFTAETRTGDTNDVSNVADGVQFARSVAGSSQSLGITKTFTGLGGSNTDSFTITMTGTFLSNDGSFTRPLGVHLFADSATASRTSGVYAGIEEGALEIRSGGNNGTVSQTATWTPGFTSGDNLTFTVNGIYTATDLNLEFTLSDGSNSQSLTNSYTIAGNTIIDGTYFGASARVAAAVVYSKIDTFSVAEAIPEPATLGLIASAGALLLVFRRRRDV